MSFPNLKGKHKESSMFTPKEFILYQKKKGRLPKMKVPFSVIFCYSKSLMNYVQRNFKTTKYHGFHGEMYSINETKGNVALIGRFGIGAPVAVTIAEELIAFGVKEIITIGMAGSLQSYLKTGDIMLCNRAIRDEGTSYHYIKPSKYAHASKKMTRRIETALRIHDQNYFIGTSWTIDAPYRETIAEAQKFQKEGVSAVEMETAALFAVGKYRNIEIGSLFVISDSLAELEWKPNFYSKQTEKGLESLCKVAISALTNKKKSAHH